MESKGLIYSNQLSIFGKPNVVGYSNGKLHVEEIDRDKSNDLIREHHYSHKIYNGTYIHLGVYIDTMLVGVLQYGYAMNPASCDGVVKGTEMNQYLELNRMWLDDIAARNSESMAISCSIVYIKHRYPKIKWIQSFADERCAGTCRAWRCRWRARRRGRAVRGSACPPPAGSRHNPPVPAPGCGCSR